LLQKLYKEGKIWTRGEMGEITVEKQKNPKDRNGCDI
jgi:hypothetical protein